MSTETTLVVLLFLQLLLLVAVAGVAVRSARARDALALQLDDALADLESETLTSDRWHENADVWAERARVAQDERDAAVALLEAVTTNRHRG